MAIYKHEFQQFLKASQASGWRGLVHIAGSQEWAEQLLANLLDDQVLLKPVYTKQNVQQLQQQLGTEANCIVINAFQGLSPNMLGMVSASIVAGGVLIIISPLDWQEFGDPDYQRMLGAIDAQHKNSRHFLQRVQCFFSQAQQYLYLSQNGIKQRLYKQDSPINLRPYQEQEQAIKHIERVATGRARRPLVITADRGRGKSAALGIAAANLLRTTDYNIAVTSVSKPSVARLFHYLAEELALVAGQTRYQYKQASITYYPIDVLLAEEIDCRLLIIDEAAAVPMKLLQRCLEKHSRVVLATTVNGYEGSGKGFELRFLPYLQDKLPHTTQVFLEQPLRWQQGDPLEVLINQLLLLDVEPITPPEEIGAYAFTQLTAQELLADEALLRQFYAILLNAHYQTSPDDLRMMLDHPKVRLFACLAHGMLIAAAVIMEEGGLSKEWQDKLAQGRRPAGHLLPQVLYVEGYQQALGMTYSRVVRIAVHAALQRQGTGQGLLQFIEQQCSTDVLGASFALSSDTLPFWQSQGFSLCRIGSSREASTAQFPLMVLKPVSEHSIALLEQVRQNFLESLPLLLLTQNNSVDTELVPLLLQGEEISQLSQRDRYLCLEFSQQRRSVEQVFNSLYRLALQLASRQSEGMKKLLNTEYLLIDKLLLAKSWRFVISKYGLVGRKEAENMLREQVARYLIGE